MNTTAPQYSELKDDILLGVAEILQYLGGETRFSKRQVYYLIERGVIPTKKLGHRTIISWKSKIDAALRDGCQS